MGSRKINTNLGITIILVFSALFVIIDFYLVGVQLDGYPFDIYDKKNISDNSINDNSSTIIKNNIPDVEESYITTTSVNVLLQNRDSLANVVVSDGILRVIFNGVNRDFTIPDEMIKCIYLDYFQSSDTNVIFVLTESGHIYVNEFTVFGSDIEVFNNFKMLNYLNVKELKLVDNENFGNVDELGIPDDKMSYLYALIDGDLIKVDNQYKMWFE